ncbi:glycosyltransferase family 4 protein [Thermovenabulum gondwanense]|uniref:D-inositol 3-phosphate glycosyltransferase n=1 Tax=Thermovenabulum gondwanense TaxID=520767 RepID=A0A162MJC2_9FIRM|nr:glycosyltransferase family 4 protein [Thermovenabulum gondwanense]KYO66350.1 D-inositol 3-phosphate glycosyltransferase [Thermovenabulum gondwanense]
MDKKVLIVVRQCTGGMRTHINLLVEGLMKENFTIFLAGPKDILHPNLDGNVEKFFEISLKNVYNIKECLKILILILHIIKKEKIHLIHSHGFLATLICIFVKYLSGVRLVATIHNIPKGHPICLFFLKKCDLVIAVSEAVKNELIFRYRLSKNKICVIYNSLPEYKISSNIYALNPLFSSKIKVLCPSRLTREKGVDVLIKAAKILKDELNLTPKDIKFYIAGNGPEEKKLKKLSVKLDLGDYIVFLGQLENIYEVMSRCDILVLPSRMEGFGISLLEAFSLKKAVIASNTGGIPEIIKDMENGLLFKNQDPLSLALCLKKIIKNPGLAYKLAEAGYDTLPKKFDYNTMIKKIIYCYETLL